jgi:hypothetical protein
MSVFGLWRLRALRDRLQQVVGLRAAERAVSAFPRVKTKEKHELSFPVMISLTSYPPRFQFLSKTIKSLIDQDIVFDRIVLWVSEDDFDFLPQDVLSLQDFGLEICKCKELLSYKKLIPAVEKFPEYGIVTADDDIYYPKNWLRSLLYVARSEHKAIVCTRAHIAKVSIDGRLEKYESWVLDTHLTSDISECELLFPTGGAGALYPPNIFPRILCDESKFLSLCPRADDLWFFWIAEMSNIKHIRTVERFPLICWQGSQESGLFYDNLLNGGNNEQIKNLENFFGLLKNLS